MSLVEWPDLLSKVAAYNFPMPFKRTRKEYDSGALYEYAVGALARQMRTVAEIKRLMRNRVKDQEHGELLVEFVVAKLKEQKYLNDTSYAENYSRFRKENEKFGRMRVIQDLKDQRRARRHHRQRGQRRLRRRQRRETGARVFAAQAHRQARGAEAGGACVSHLDAGGLQ